MPNPPLPFATSIEQALSINVLLWSQVEELTRTIQRQEARIRDLETRLAQNSSNSSRPTSKDAPWSKPKRKPPEGSSGCKAGGQAGKVGGTRGRLEADEARDDVPDRYEWPSLWNFLHEFGVDLIGDELE